VKRTVPSPLRRILARNLRSIRATLGWSQERLAAEAGVNRTYLSAVEREEQNISLDNIHKLAVALELEAMHLINARADFSVDGLAHLRSQPPTGGTRPNNLA
jgi:transcriptional regulator with XRE-family HTH domain